MLRNLPAVGSSRASGLRVVSAALGLLGQAWRCGRRRLPLLLAWEGLWQRHAGILATRPCAPQAVFKGRCWTLYQAVSR